MSVNRQAILAAVAILATTAFPGWVLAQANESFEDWPTRPSDLRQLSFTQPGRIAEAFVEEGDMVNPGDALIRLDDERERKELEILQVLADDKVRVDYAAAALGQAEVDERILLSARAEEADAVTEMELQHAHLEVQLKRASRDIAALEQTQAVVKCDQMKLMIEKMRIDSPMAGRVERIFLKEGESADALEKVIVIVQSDPLWVDLPVPVMKARGLKIGQTAQVRYAEDVLSGAKVEPMIAKIVHKASLVESGSNTLTVRVEVPNPSLRPAGERVQVAFDAPAGAKAPAAIE